MARLVGESEMADWSNDHVWQFKFKRDILTEEVSAEEPYTGLPSSRFQCQEEKSPLILAVKTNEDCA